jgi:hypothetical protein
LPAGIYPVDWGELSSRFGGTPRREWLLQGLKAAAEVLRACGCSTLYLNGSFASSKPDPNDYDACWLMAGVRLHERARSEPVFFDFAEAAQLRSAASAVNGFLPT